MSEPKEIVEVKGLGKIMYSIELRDIFAASVLNGLISGQPGCWEDLSMNEQTHCAYQYADAMLKARERK